MGQNCAFKVLPSFKVAQFCPILIFYFWTPKIFSQFLKRKSKKNWTKLNFLAHISAWKLKRFMSIKLSDFIFWSWWWRNHFQKVIKIIDFLLSHAALCPLNNLWKVLTKRVDISLKNLLRFPQKLSSLHFVTRFSSLALSLSIGWKKMFTIYYIFQG